MCLSAAPSACGSRGCLRRGPSCSFERSSWLPPQAWGAGGGCGAVPLTSERFRRTSHRCRRTSEDIFLDTPQNPAEPLRAPPRPLRGCGESGCLGSAGPRETESAGVGGVDAEESGGGRGRERSWGGGADSGRGARPRPTELGRGRRGAGLGMRRRERGAGAGEGAQKPRRGSESPPGL